MRFACVDIGTNTTRLLVAEVHAAAAPGVREVRCRRAFVRLSASECAAGVRPEKAAELCAVVAGQVAQARADGAAALRVVGTAALRELPDRHELIALIEQAAGATVEILTAEEEARLAFLGATAGIASGEATVAVVDVGGGSTEVAAGRPGSPPGWWVSVPLGSSVLTDLDLPADPPTPDQLRRAHERAQAALGAIGCPPAERAWAVGGSATTLRRVVGADLTASALSHALDAVTQLPSPEAAARLDVHAQRARLLPAGLVLLATVASVLGCPLGVAGGGLREGVVLDLAARMG